MEAEVLRQFLVALYAHLARLIMGLDRGNETTTQLLTLLNVSATKAGKRKWESDEPRPKEKLNKRRVVLFEEPTTTIAAEASEPVENGTKEAQETAQLSHVAATAEDPPEDEDEDTQGAHYFAPPRLFLSKGPSRR